MKRALATSLSLFLLAISVAGCGSSSDLSKDTTQRDFGVRMARQNLWREALFRFKRAVEISPGDAMARNNLAVALEANGDFDAAAREYKEAMRLDKSNQFIQKNYSRFVEFTSRNKKRQQKAGAAAAATATTAPATPAAEGGGAPLSPAQPAAQPVPTPAPVPQPNGGQR
jgi:Tfp pilus assembly protein PilF